MSDITPSVAVVFCILITAIVLFVPSLVIDLLTKNKDKYLIAYSFTKEVRGGVSIRGYSNYFSNIDITDKNSLIKLRNDIEKEYNVDKVTILNIIKL